MKKKNSNFEYFKKRCEHWIKILGLKMWNIEILMVDDKSDEGWDVYVYRDITGRTAEIRWWKGCEYKGDKYLDKIAFEESCHILLANLSYYGASYYNKLIITEEEHIVINMLYNALNYGKEK